MAKRRKGSSNKGSGGWYFYWFYLGFSNFAPRLKFRRFFKVKLFVINHLHHRHRRKKTEERCRHWKCCQCVFGARWRWDHLHRKNWKPHLDESTDQVYWYCESRNKRHRELPRELSGFRRDHDESEKCERRSSSWTVRRYIVSQSPRYSTMPYFEAVKSVVSS